MSLLLAELLVRVTALDLRIIEPTLYRVENDMSYSDDQEAYRPSSVPGLLYETIPSQEVRCGHCTHPKETLYDATTLRTNSLGFRDSERRATKPEDTVRVIVFGGSNTWAATASNPQTPTAQLEHQLNTIHPGRFEVWNGGLNANVMVQKVIAAERAIERYQPDLLIFQHHNQGRRAFFHRDPNIRARFALDPELYLENFPAPQGSGQPAPRHEALTLRSAFYRALVGARFRLLLWRHVSTCDSEDPAHPGCLPPDLSEPTALTADAIAYQRWTGFLDRHPDIPMMVFDPIFETWCSSRPASAPGPHPDGFLGLMRPDRPNLRYVSTCWGDRPAEFRDIHPPTYVYQEYAEQLAPLVLDHLGLTAPTAAPPPP